LKMNNPKFSIEIHSLDIKLTNSNDQGWNRSNKRWVISWNMSRSGGRSFSEPVGIASWIKIQSGW
jgi:hypothetical protein